MTIGEARAHQQYGDCMFCPGCLRLLTGLHMESRCCASWIEKKAQKLGGSDEPIIIGLAIAVIIGIGIVCLKNKLK